MANLNGLRIIILIEGEYLVAQCLEYDVCVQSKDRYEELMNRLDIALDIDSANAGSAPCKFLDAWQVIKSRAK